MERLELFIIYAVAFAITYFVAIGLALGLGRLIFPRIESDGEGVEGDAGLFPESKNLRSRSRMQRVHDRSIRSLHGKSIKRKYRTTA